MHWEGQGSAAIACGVCGVPFTPKRASWAKFCSPRCRNAFHAAEARREKIRDRALVMYACLAELAAQGNEAAAQAIAGLKPPAEVVKA